MAVRSLAGKEVFILKKRVYMSMFKVESEQSRAW